MKNQRVPKNKHRDNAALISVPISFSLACATFRLRFTAQINVNEINEELQTHLLLLSSQCCLIFRYNLLFMKTADQAVRSETTRGSFAGVARVPSKKHPLIPGGLRHVAWDSKSCSGFAGVQQMVSANVAIKWGVLDRGRRERRSKEGTAGI